jgi:hypothetical protein
MHVQLGMQEDGVEAAVWAAQPQPAALRIETRPGWVSIARRYAVRATRASGRRPGCPAGMFVPLHQGGSPGHHPLESKAFAT